MALYIEVQERTIVMKHEKTISTGFRSLDRVLGGGFHCGSLHVIAARPGMGKTVFSLQCAAGLAKVTDKKIYIFSLEMSRDYVKEKFTELCTRDSVILDDTVPVTPSQIREKLAGISDPGAVIIDYFQLLQLGGGTCGQNTAISADKIARELKQIAKKFDIPVICTSGLSRALEKRRDCHPVLRDLDKGSGGLVQDTDVILFLYRHAYYDIEYYDTEEIEDPDGAEVIVAKNCFGECEDLPFRFEGEIPQFTEEI